MAKRVSVDRWLFGVTLLLVFAGLVMVFSASAIVAKEKFGSETAFLLKQGIYAVVGLAAMFGFMKSGLPQAQPAGAGLHHAGRHLAVSGRGVFPGPLA